MNETALGENVSFLKPIRFNPQIRKLFHDGRNFLRNITEEPQERKNINGFVEDFAAYLRDYNIDIARKLKFTPQQNHVLNYFFQAIEDGRFRFQRNMDIEEDPDNGNRKISLYKTSKGQDDYRRNTQIDDVELVVSWNQKFNQPMELVFRGHAAGDTTGEISFIFLPKKGEEIDLQAKGTSLHPLIRGGLAVQLDQSQNILIKGTDTVYPYIRLSDFAPGSLDNISTYSCHALNSPHHPSKGRLRRLEKTQIVQPRLATIPVGI